MLNNEGFNWTIALGCGDTHTYDNLCGPTYMQAKVDNAADKEKELKDSQKEPAATAKGVALKSKASEDNKELEVCTMQACIVEPK